MHALRLPFEKGSSPQVLFLGAHSDDIEIGCGGTILRIAEMYPSAVFHWVVFSADGVRADEANKAAQLFGNSNLRQKPVLKQFKDGFMPYNGGAVKEIFEELKTSVTPDLVFTHYRNDAHQDHRLLSELTRNTFRDHIVLEYEIPKYDGDIGQPNFFVPLELQTCETKVTHLMSAFGSQAGKRWFRKELFFALMRLRGMECNSSSGYAEAFYAHKLSL
jgi:LmbE family N-acetylglucosaminyl deacetylase